jgi:hypothetical protein
VTLKRCNFTPNAAHEKVGFSGETPTYVYMLWLYIDDLVNENNLVFFQMDSFRSHRGFVFYISLCISIRVVDTMTCEFAKLFQMQRIAKYSDVFLSNYFVKFTILGTVFANLILKMELSICRSHTRSTSARLLYWDINSKYAGIFFLE